MLTTGLRYFLFSFIALCLMSLNAFADKRVALVIGNSAYKNVTALPNPVNDANAVATLLRNAHFDVVESKQNLGVDELRRAIRDFSDAVRDADIAVVYYAGHGIEIDGTNYLVPTDAALERDIDVEDETLSVDRILRTLEPARRLRVVILDACRDNPFTRSMKRTVASRSVGRGLARVEPASSDTLIAFAAKAGSTSADGDGSNSPFTTALLKHVATPGLDLRIAFGQVRDDVLKATNNRQEPFVYGSLGGSTVSLVPAPEPPKPQTAAPTTDPDPNAAARRDYESFERVGTTAAWRAFLTLYPEGPYSELARAQLAKATAAEQALNSLQPPAPSVAAKQESSGPAAEPKPQATPAAPVIAAVSPPQTPGAPPETPPAALAPGEVARQLQAELKRVGCYSGDADGDWGSNSRKALDAFNRHAHQKFDTGSASLDALNAVRETKARLCAPDCPRGTEASAEGSCQPIKDRRAVARPPTFIPDPSSGSAPGIGIGIGLGHGTSIYLTPGQGAAPSRAPPSSGARMACDRFGCKPVPKGCSVRSEVFKDMTQDTVVCP